MKSGSCPKCNSDEVYLDENAGHGVVITIHLLAFQMTDLYVCADCGYLEIYSVVGADLRRVKEKFKKVKR